MSRNDEQIDRLLTALHGRGDAAPSADCLDADALAAWMDGRLGVAALARAEAHAAACGHCQAMLAAMARAAGAAPAPEVGAPARSGFRRLLPWAAPLTAAATAAALYIAVRPPAAFDEMRPTSAARSGTAVEAVPPSAVPEASARESDAAREVAGRDVGRAQAQAAAPDPRMSREAESAAGRREREERLAAVPLSSKPLADAAPPVPMPNAPAPGAVADATRRAAGQSSEPPRLQRTEQHSIPPQVPSSAGQSTKLPSGRADVGRPAGEVASRAALAESVSTSPPIAIATPDPSIRWRVSGGALVERSTDGGATWTTQEVKAPQELTAGAAASADVCWIVGRAGAVLRTTDGGRAWIRVEFPERADLTAVLATSAEGATVTTADGRTFTTADGGRTWLAGR